MARLPFLKRKVNQSDHGFARNLLDFYHILVEFLTPYIKKSVFHLYLAQTNSGQSISRAKQIIRRERASHVR